MKRKIAIPNITAVFILFLAGFVCLPVARAETDKYRLSWRSDPTRSVVIGWNQVDGQDPKVQYGPTDHGKNAEKYPKTAEVDVERDYRGMQNRFVRLENLLPDTAYYFVIRDSNSTSRRLWFRTAPDKPKPFTMIAGGDTRTNREPRRAGNRMVSKLRPLFITHGGDYMGSGSAEEWQTWLDDWQLTISEDGRIYPLVPAHGNHENRDKEMVYKLFDMPRPEMYSALDVGGTMLRVYTLNTEIAGNNQLWRQQNKWFAKDLRQNKKRKWKFVQYHRPMRAHTSGKGEGLKFIKSWAQLFYKYGVDLAIECDTHMVKRTYPLRPSDGPDSYESFVRDDKRGTVFIGEGSWGAPKRPADDDKPWTMASDSFYQFKWIQVTPKHVDIRSVRFDNAGKIKAVSDAAPYAMPEGLRVWKPKTGAVLRLPFGR